MTIKNLTEAKAILATYVSKTAHPTDKDLKLERMSNLLGVLGDPHAKMKVIHIAGTSGKTSTSYYVTALLEAAGAKTGLTVSPHVDGVNERVQINGKPLSEAKFCSELGKFLDIAASVKPHPSYFELLTAFAFWEFVREKVDYAVLETGLGGLYDATNVATRPDKVCVITDIGFDHMEVLGDTLDLIASQKAGIIHDRNHVFMYAQADEVMKPVLALARQHDATTHVLDEEDEFRDHRGILGDLPDYRQRNWVLAYAVYRYLAKRDGLGRLTDQALRDSQSVRIPGRMDAREIEGKTVVMDGAHNGQKMSACIRSFKLSYPGVRPAVMLSLKDTKDYGALAPLLKPFAGRIIITTFETTQDSQARSMNPDVLAGAFRAAGLEEVEVVPDQHEAYEALLKSPEKVCLITGSFYLLSQLRDNEGLR